jgi:outer membrane protein
MKKMTLGLCCALALSASAQASDLSLALGTDYWNPTPTGTVDGNAPAYDDSSLWTFWADFRHGIPLLPNVNLQRTSYDTQGFGLHNDLTAWDLALYYRLFDNDLFGIGGGMVVRQLDGDIYGHSYSEMNPLGYLQAEVNIPGTSISGFGDARFSQWDGEHSHDYRVGMAVEFVPNFNLRGGYRNVRLDGNVDGVELAQRMDGWFAGAEYRF